MRWLVLVFLFCACESPKINFPIIKKPAVEYGELDTIVLHTAKGQIINLSLQTGRNGFSMVIAHDILSLKRADSCTFEEYKDHERSVYRLPYQLEFRYHVEDSIFHFPEPLEVYELSDLSVLA